MAVAPNPGLLELAPYKGGDSTLPGFSKVIKLASNENPLGASPAAIAAFKAAAAKLHLYPDGHARALKAAIAARYDLDPARIVCGAGSDEIFLLLARAYLMPGDAIVQSQFGFLIYAIAAKTAGAAVKVAPDRNHTVDVDAMLAAVTPEVKLVFLANPNNPTGTYLPAKEVARLHAGLPETTMLVIDAAYAEYMRQDDYEAGLELAARAPNVIMTRTFSKIHGLAALRVGWAYASAEIIDVLHRVRGPFNVNIPAQEAAAAAIADREFAEASAAHNARELARLEAALDRLGYCYTPSVANFSLVHFEPEGPFTAAACDAFLRTQGIIARRVSAYGLPHAMRLSVGATEENTALIAALTAFKAQA
jgi:histidinol-phosphate aminotransferase